MHTIQNQGSAAMNRKQVFAISSHIYQTASQDYLLLHKFLCHNHLQNTAIQTSQELQQKLVLQVMSKADYTKHMNIYCHNYYYNKSNSGHQTKNQHIKHQDNQNHKPLFKVFESKSIFIDYYTIAPVFNTRSIIHGNTKWEQISFSDYNYKTTNKVSKVSPKSSTNSLINKAQHLEP